MNLAKNTIIIKKEQQRKLLQRLNQCLRNAHYWLDECKNERQTKEAVMEARGITMALSEGLGGFMKIPEIDEGEEETLS